MTAETDEGQQALTKIKTALADPDVRLAIVQTLGYGKAVQVYIRTRKIGPLMLPSEGETIADVLFMLGTMIIENDQPQETA